MSGSKFDRNEMYHNLTDPTPKMVQGLVGLTKEVQEIKEATNGVPFKDLATKEEVKVVSDKVATNTTDVGKLKSKTQWVDAKADFGAKGDGKTDDVKSIQDAINSLTDGGTLVLKGNFNISASLTMSAKKRVNIIGNGVLKATARISPMLKLSSCEDCSVQGITFDGASLATRGLETLTSPRTKIDDCTVKNIGNRSETVATTGIFIKEGCENSTIIDSKVLKVESGTTLAASGIWLESMVAGTAPSRHVAIDNCYVEDIYPIGDADGVKILNGTYTGLVNLVVSNSKFVNCRKRGLKFQAKGCKSINNYIEFNEPDAYAGVDFQRGYGSSTGDTVVSNIPASFTTGAIFYSVAQVAGAAVTIDNLSVTNLSDTTKLTSYSRIVGISALDNQEIKDVSILNSKLTGHQIRVSSNVTSLKIIGNKIDVLGASAMAVDSGVVLEDFIWDNNSVSLPDSTTDVLGDSVAPASGFIRITSYASQEKYVKPIARNPAVEYHVTLSKSVSPMNYHIVNDKCVTIVDGNPQTTAWSRFNALFKYAKVGDIAYKSTTAEGFQEVWECVESPSTNNPRGVWRLKPNPSIVDVRQFGAVGDGATDEGGKILNAIQALKSGGTLYFPGGKNFLTTSTITIPVGVHVVMDSPLTYKGTGQALVIGQSGSSNNRVNLKLDVVKETQSDWTSEDVIGIKLINTITSSIDIVRAQGFTIGVQCIGSGGGFVYNEISLGDISNNKIGVDCTNETSGGIGWCNENQFIGGRFWCGSSTNLTKSRYGVRITSKDGTYVVNNNNNFLKPSFELKTPNIGEAIPVLVEQGEQNAFKECRNESNSATFARISNNSTENTFTTGYGFVTVEDNSNFPASFTSSRRDESIDNMNKLIFNSGNLREKTVPYDGSTTFNVAGMFIGNSGNASTNKALTGITMNTNSITVSSSRAIGIRIPTSSAKRFVVRRDVNPSNAGRISIRCFDANSSLLYSTSTAYVKGKSNRAPVANSAFGGVYRMGAVSQQDFFFAVSDEVKFVDVLFSEGEISSMSIYTDAANLSTPFNPVTDEKESLALTAPTIGGWKKGKRLYNDDLFPGGYLGWVCTQSGEFGTATEPIFNPFGLISE